MKRLFDVVVALIMLVLAFPLMVIISLLILLSDGPPVIFKHKRMGLNGREFWLLKFRTMYKDAGGPGITTGNNDPRITPVGRFLRKYRLDELPQLINVLKGEMSIVGPRPEIPEYRQYYQGDYEKILSVRPGMTDPATLIFMDEGTILQKQQDPLQYYEKVILPQKLNLYRQYVENATLWQDIIILMKTFFKLILPSRTPPKTNLTP